MICFKNSWCYTKQQIGQRKLCFSKNPSATLIILHTDFGAEKEKVFHNMTHIHPLALFFFFPLSFLVTSRDNYLGQLTR